LCLCVQIGGRDELWVARSGLCGLLRCKHAPTFVSTFLCQQLSFVDFPFVVFLSLSISSVFPVFLSLSLRFWGLFAMIDFNNKRTNG